MSVSRDFYQASCRVEVAWKKASMNVWEIAILKSIKSLGGEAGLQQIYKRLLSSYLQDRGFFAQSLKKRK